MFEKSILVAVMAALVWGAFHFYGETETAPRAVIVQAPIAADTVIVE